MQEPPPNSDPVCLHPVFREKVRSLLDRLNAEGIPFRLFEGFRSLERQQYLYAHGRAGWSSYHRYGLAADFALSEENAGNWRRWREIAEQLGLVTSSFEPGHVQLAGLKSEDLEMAA
jgi:peptidoglycan L-alanyl-D-glutamate endopeptidase CwlK